MIHRLCCLYPCMLNNAYFSKRTTGLRKLASNALKSSFFQLPIWKKRFQVTTLWCLSNRRPRSLINFWEILIGSLIPSTLVLDSEEYVCRHTTLPPPKVQLVVKQNIVIYLTCLTFMHRTVFQHEWKVLKKKLTLAWLGFALTIQFWSCRWFCPDKIFQGFKSENELLYRVVDVLSNDLAKHW